MRYLRETADLTLTFGNRHFDGDCPLTCMVDSNYIGDGDSCYSNTGYVFYFIIMAVQYFVNQRSKQQCPQGQRKQN